MRAIVAIYRDDGGRRIRLLCLVPCIVITFLQLLHSGLQFLHRRLGACIQLHDAITNIRYICHGHTEYAKPRWTVWQGNIQFTGTQVDAGAGNRLRCIAHEYVRAEGIIHEVP